MNRGWHSRGYLPHFDGGEIAQAITFRLGDSLPQTVLKAWREELSRENAANTDAALRRRIESYLDQGHGSSWLKDARGFDGSASLASFRRQSLQIVRMGCNAQPPALDTDTKC